MASIKVILWKHQAKEDGTYPLRIRITQNRKSSYVNVKNYSLLENQWDEKTGTALPTYTNYKRLNILLAKKKSEVEERLLDLEIKNKNISPSELQTIIKGKKNEDFFSYAYEFAERYNNPSQIQTYGKYVMILKELQNFSGKTYMEFEEITYTFLDRYLQDLISKDKMPATIELRFNKIKAIWNYATHSGKIDRNNYPFWNLKLPKVTPKMPPKLEFEDIEKLKKYKAPKESNEYHAVNSFLFCYASYGMRAGDMIRMKVGNIVNGRLEHTSQKSKKLHSVSFDPFFLKIIKEYTKGKKKEDYLFPWYEKIKECDPWRKVNTAISLYNKALKKVGEKAKIDKKITSHIARHTWAWHAQLKMVDKKIIKAGLGHSKDATTDIYMGRFPSQVMDEANRKIVGK